MAHGSCALELALAANVSANNLPGALDCVCDLGYTGTNCDECVAGFTEIPPQGQEGVMCMFPDISVGQDFGDDDGAPIGMAVAILKLRVRQPMPETESLQEEFKISFANDIAMAMAIPSSRVDVRGISSENNETSVQFALLPLRNDTVVSYEDLIQKMMEQVVDPASALRSSTNIGRSIDPSSLTVASLDIPSPLTGLSTIDSSSFRNKVLLGKNMKARWFLHDVRVPSEMDAIVAQRRP